jgi:hypothetical protein
LEQGSAPDADRITVYTPFEVRCIRCLRDAVPELTEPLEEILGKLIDLKAVVFDRGRR